MPTIKFASLLCALGVFLFGIAEPAVAMDKFGKWDTRGIGAPEQSCRQFISANEAIKKSFEQWLLGYISGVNRVRTGKPDFSEGWSVPQLLGWVEEYCRENPEASFGHAVGRLIAHIQRDR